MNNSLISEVPLWFKKRSYLHFDRPILPDKANSIVLNPKTVSQHAFYPFISYSFNVTKLSRDKITNKLYRKEKVRDVAYSSHIDSHIYAYYADIISAHYEDKLQEKGLHDSVLAFRKINKKNNIHFANDVFNYIKDKGECSAIALDFSSFFDTLDHSILKREWSNILGLTELPSDHYNVFRSLTKFSKVDRDKVFELFNISPHNPKLNGNSKHQSQIKNKRLKICEPHEFRSDVRKPGLISSNKKNCGIPQGSPISALLSNIYMLSFDEKMKDYANSINGTYFRYCDDMLFVVPTSERKEVLVNVTTEISKLYVTINESKTEIRDFKYHSDKLSSVEGNKQKPLQYLGFLFDGSSIFLRSASLSRYSEKMKGGVKLAKNTMDKENRIRESKGEPLQTELYKRKLHRLYTHRGQRNFLSYGYRAAKIMDSKSIKKQLKPLQKRFEEEVMKE